MTEPRQPSELTSPAALDQLAQRTLPTDVGRLLEIATHPATLGSTLYTLATTDWSDALLDVLPPDMADEAESRSLYLTEELWLRIAAHPNVDEATLHFLLDGREWTEHEEMLLAMAENPATSHAVLDDLISSTDHRVRLAVALHPACAKETMEVLLADKDPETSAVAIAAMRDLRDVDDHLSVDDFPTEPDDIDDVLLSASVDEVLAGDEALEDM